MQGATYVHRFEQIGREDLEEVGGKAANLGELVGAGIPVPPGLVLTTAAYRAFLTAGGIDGALLELSGEARAQDTTANEDLEARIAALFRSADVPAEVRDALLSGCAELGDGPVAVRSSATTEDLEDASFAGQQETYLGVRGEEALLEAVRNCWASLYSARALAYRAERGIAPEQVALAVVVQRMVAADAAGVMFTANPASGRREETVISAAWGLGEAVVSGQVDTDDLVVDTAAGRVLSRATADKQVMVMQPDSGGTVTVPVPEDRRRAPVLSDTRALDLAAWGSRITEHFGAPQDVEWALAGTELMITQARPIIALPPPSGPVPATWPVPREHSAYFRGSIIEQMPDPLSPLFADLARAYVTVGMGQTLEDASGSTAFAADGFDLTTVNGYAYLGVRNSAMVLLTAKAGLMVPRIVRQGIGGPQYWATVGRPRYRELVAEQKARLDIDGTADAATLLDVVRECVLGGFAYYTVVQTVIPPVVIAETLLATFCKRVHRDGDPSAETLLFGYESAPIRAEQSLFDLAAWVREVDDGALARALVAADAPPDSCPEDVDGADFDAFTDAFRAHLSEHGHQTFTLDLMAPVAEDTPTLLWDVLRMYLRGEGTDPRVRRERAAVARETGSARIRAHLRGPLPGTFDRLLRRAQRLNPIREDALADVGLGWPTARRALLELGARLVARGVLDEAPDVFWLHLDEADDLVRELDAAPDATLPSRRAGIERRRAAWRGQLRALPPQILPEKSAWQSLNRWMPSKVAASDAALEGIGASGGTVTGTVRVLTDPARFHEFQVGEILVAAITTPAWTPLFAMAAGVVTDVGGPLSHSSIVAREYGIPAVLGTGRATRILHTGQTVTIDGTAGTVTIVEE